MRRLTNQAKNAVVAQATSKAIDFIQKKLDIPDGDYAAIFFNGLFANSETEIQDILIKYIEFEESYRMKEAIRLHVFAKFNMANEIDDSDMRKIYARTENIIEENGYEYAMSIEREFERELESYKTYINLNE